MDLMNYYNTNILGYYPGDNQSEKTMCTISYLRDCGFKDNDILKIINEVMPQEAFTPDMLPERLWDGSLLKKDGLYLHRELRVPSPVPAIDRNTGKEIKTNLYNEMKIMYTVDNLLDYYYDKLSIPLEFRNRKRDTAQFNTLLKHYGMFNGVAGVEIMLDLIDQTCYEFITVLNPFDLENPHKIASAYEGIRKAKLRPEAGVIWRGKLNT